MRAKMLWTRGEWGKDEYFEKKDNNLDFNTAIGGIKYLKLRCSLNTKCTAKITVSASKQKKYLFIKNINTEHQFH